MTVYGVWYVGRNTPVVVSAEGRYQAIQKAKRTKAAGSKGKVVTAKKLVGKDLKLARSGKWVRTRSDGSNPTDTKTKSQASKHKSKFRKGPAQQSKSK